MEYIIRIMDYGVVMAEFHVNKKDFDNYIGTLIKDNIKEVRYM